MKLALLHEALGAEALNDPLQLAAALKAYPLELAAARIRAYHERQRPEDASWTDASGATLGWRWTPVSAAGLYVPGGLASYPSSVLMNAIPAKVAGVDQVIACLPPNAHQAMIAGCHLSGADRIFRVGGAQAIAR